MTLKIALAALTGLFVGAFAWEHARKAFHWERLDPFTPPKDPENPPKNGNKPVEKVKDWRDIN